MNYLFTYEEEFFNQPSYKIEHAEYSLHISLSEQEGTVIVD